MRYFQRGFVFCVAILGFVGNFFAYSEASAQTLSFAAEPVIPKEIVLAPGQSQNITLKFKNIGSKTWVSGRSNVALYVYGDSSVFSHSSWLRNDEPTLLDQKSVASQGTGSTTFWVTAPTKVGVYHQDFLLSSGPNTWIKGSRVSLTFRVQSSTSAPALPSTILNTTSSSTFTQTIDPKLWKAELIDRGGTEWQLEPQGHTIITLAFRNRGTQTWKKTGAEIVTLSTIRGTDNAFKDFSWKSNFRAAELIEASVRPGDIGHLKLEIRAPDAPGNYQIPFELAQGDRSITGSQVTISVRVTTPPNYIAKGSLNGMEIAADGTFVKNSERYKATLLLASTKNVSVSGRTRQNLTYGFKNAGSASWSTLSLRVAGVQAATSDPSTSIYDESWYSSVEPVKSLKVTAPGEIGFVAFTLKAPVKKGTYTVSFQLYADDQPVQDGLLDIPITVTADGPMDDLLPPSNPSNASSSDIQIPSLTTDPNLLPTEPIIRVGLFATTDNQMVVRAISSGFSLQEKGVAICRFAQGASVTVSYDRIHHVSRAAGTGCAAQTSEVFIVVADDGLSPLELTDFSRPVSWLPGANDNKFRGKLELRYTPKTDSVWIINELPIEGYLKGLGETSNSSPQEYQRALLTAARTYAMYHVQRGTKHADENYTVDAKYDQVYRGYGAEIRDPAVVTAVDATRGQIVTFNGTLAITPYYSRSDGRTRSWTEVWGGDPKPWLVSVPVPWDKGRTLWGHGVGMSATGALGMANDGKNYDEILKYFYTGTELRRAYK